MPNSATAQLMGHLGQDPELKYSQAGTAFAKGTIAVKTGYGERSVTTWWSYTIFGKKAELLADWASKGQAVLLIGTPYLEEWQAKDGTTQKTAKLDVNDFTVINDKSHASPPSGTRAIANEPNDAIPF